MKHRPLYLALLLGMAATFQGNAGTLYYTPIPAAQSDAGSGISTESGYTSAVDGGNSQGSDRVINGITLFSLVGNADSASADNCTLNALSGTLSNGGGKAASIQADGTMGEVLSDMTFSNGAGDNSQQEIVLDPESLEAGTTYDLRVYVCNSAGQNRQVNMAFAGDGQAVAETGWFNEDDARTSPGGFKDANQVYYITYRYVWDGDSTPGITITQKSGSAPFCLYALTNQVVAGGGATAAGGGAASGAGSSGGPAAQTGAAAIDQGADTGLVNAESDEVGVESDDFYSSDSLNSNGRWVEIDKWGKCWQPTTVSAGWSPYTNGSWRNCDDCGWTFASDEPWAWACYHYGRWCKVRSGCGWAWVPGKVWAASWVSWRQGRDESCSCVGWAPLPPEASCRIDVGINNWVDTTCDIGPDCYTFVNVRDFGSDSYSGCGCMYEHSRNITIINETINITNICYNRDVTYCGGPDYNWCNERIRKFGGKEVSQIHVNRYDDDSKIPGGKHSRLEGNQLALLSPRVHGEKNPKHAPKVAERLGRDKIDKGWGNADKKQQKQLRDKIAGENKGKDRNAKATLPADVAGKVGKHHQGGGQGAVGQASAGQLRNKQTGGGVNQHPGGKGRKGQDQLGNANAMAGAGGQSGRNQHPGGKGKHGQGAVDATGASATTTGLQPAGGSPKVKRHPGQSNKGANNASSGGGAGQGGVAATASGATPMQGGGKHHGKGRNQTGQLDPNAGGAAAASSSLGAQGGGTSTDGGKHHGKKGSQAGQANPATVGNSPPSLGGQGAGTPAGGTNTNSGSGGGHKGRHKAPAAQNSVSAADQGQTGAVNAPANTQTPRGSKKHGARGAQAPNDGAGLQQQQQAQLQQQQTQEMQQQKALRHQQKQLQLQQQQQVQQQQQQQQQQQVQQPQQPQQQQQQQQQGGGGRGKHKHGTPTPTP
ncbi:MAG: DUF6600 domain-containing protein, partial [Spartobacteria bacterium]